MIQFKDLFEQLTRSEEVKADKMTDYSHYSNRMAFLEMHHPDTKRQFVDASEDVNNRDKQFSLRVPISITEHSGTPNSRVLDFLESKNITTTHDDYKSGHAYEEKETRGNPEMGIEPSKKRIKTRIGALLEKHNAPDEIKKAFTNDTFRNGAKRTEYDMIISGHPHDVFGMSTGRNGAWTSCATMRNGEAANWRGGEGPAAKKMPGEINNHTHTVYLVPRGGNVDTDAIARMNFKHHTGITTRHETLISEGQVYGTAPNSFKSIAEEHMAKLFNIHPNEVYVKNKNVYNDNGKAITITSDQLSPETLDKAWTHLSKDEDSKYTLLGRVLPGVKYKSKTLSRLSNKMDDLRKTTDFAEYAKKLSSDSDLNSNPKFNGFIYGNKHFSNDIDRISAAFDVNNAEHREAYNNLDAARSSQSNLRYAVRTSLPKAKTVTDYENLLKVVDINNKGGIKISENHSLGKTPLETIVKHLSSKDMLDHNSYHHAYLSAHKLTDGNIKSGNFYDSAVKFENDGVPGMSNVIAHSANKLLDESDNQLAKTFMRMKPQTRQRYADIMGVDHNKMIKAYKSKFPKGWDKDLASTQNYIRKLAATNPKHGYMNLNDVINGPDFNNHKYLKDLVDIIS